MTIINFVQELLRAMQGRIRKRRHLANGRTPISILPLRPASPAKLLPWEPDRIELTLDELQLLAWLSQELNQELESEEVISQSDVLHFALQELQLKLRSSDREEVLLRLGFLLWNVR
jgi:hypothetical protein